MTRQLARFKRPLSLAIGLAGVLSLIVLAAASNDPVKVVWTHSFGESRAGIVAANPVTGRVYAAEEDVPAIAVFDSATNALVATVPTQGYHSGIAVDPARNRVYVSQAFARAVRVIDGATNTFTDLEIPNLTNAIGALAVDADARRLYVLRSDDHDLAVFDTQTQHYLGPMCAGCCDPYCHQLAIDPGTHRMYLPNPEKDEVDVADTASGRRVATIAVSDRPSFVVIHPDTHRVYISQSDTNKIAVVDGRVGSATENTVVGQIQLRENPNVLTLNQAAERIYATNNGANGISVIDVTAESLLATIRLCMSPSWTASLPAQKRLYVACEGGHMLMGLAERARTFGLP